MRHDGTVHSDAIDTLIATMSPSKAMLLELEGMARSGATPEPDKIRTIKSILDDELLPDLKATRDGAAKQVKVNLAAIDTCNAKGLAKQKEIKETTEVSVNQARTQHAACREEEKNKNSTKGARCDELDNFLNAIKVPANLPKSRPRDQMVKYVKTMSVYFCPKDPTVTTLDEACKLASAEHAKHKDACEKLQDAFELGFCTWKTELTDECKALSDCYESTLKKYNDHVSDTTELVKKWKTEYGALKKILCYVDVWLSDNDVKTADADQLNKCNGSSVDTSPMDVDFGSPAAQVACPMTAVENYPGTPEFLSTEYANFLDYVDEVTPCLGHVPTHVTWNLFHEECGGAPDSTLKMEAGSDLSECNKWAGTVHGESAEVYIRVSCRGGGIQKEIWFADPECTKPSLFAAGSEGTFNVDSMSYAKEQAGECFAATCTHCKEDHKDFYMKVTGAQHLIFPKCQGAMIQQN